MEIRINTESLHKMKQKLERNRSRILLKIGNEAVNFSVEVFDRRGWNGEKLHTNNLKFRSSV